MIINSDAVSEVIRECAQSYILPRYKILEDHEISSKTGPRDLVTQADLDVEAHLQRVIPDLYPGSIVIGEEGVSNGSASLDVLRSEAGMVWIADPVDGTFNFVNHGREFGVMLACIVGGVTQYAWIYDVLGDEMTVAERGSGTFANQERLNVNEKADYRDFTGHVSPRFFPEKYREHVNGVRTVFTSCTSMCCAHEYLRIAKGHAQFSIYSRLKPWDHIPGALIVREAGGYVAQWDGREYLPKSVNVGLIAAASEANWEDVRRLFLDDIV